MGNVTSAVERVESAPPAPAQVSTATVVREAIKRQGSAFAAVLPREVDPERFARLVLTAVKSTPALVECFASPEGEMSVLLAAMQAAAVGMEPNTPLQEAWLLPRYNGRTKKTECQLAIGYRGILKLARRSGAVREIYAEVVREGDEFAYELGLHRDLRHVPAPEADRGDVTHAYAVAHYKDGGFDFIVLNRLEIEKRRASSESWKNERARQFSPWVQWFDAMAKKSAVRALAPYLPLTAEAAVALDSDERPLQFVDGAITVDEQPAIEAAPEPDDQGEPEGHPFDDEPKDAA